jgi:hypothetical protein
VKYIALLSTLLLAGCTIQKLSDEGSRVRVINTSIATQCTHIGMVKGWGPVLVGGMSYAQVQVRNRVAEVGGNALAVAAQSVSPEGHGEVIGDAYRCVF